MYERINRIDYNINPEREELLDFISNSYWGRLRGILTHDDNLYVWDADAALHNEMMRNLSISGTRFFVIKDIFDVDSNSDRLKILESRRIKALEFQVEVSM